MHASFEGGSLSLDSVSKMGVSEQLMFRNVADRRTAGAESRNLSLVPSEKPINFQTNQTDLTAKISSQTNGGDVVSNSWQMESIEVDKDGNQNCTNFDWDDYLRNTQSVPASHQCFKHIEISLFNGFSPGMKLEVANKEDANTYWVATLISTCGSLLLLRYDGCGEDRKSDFWADVSSADLHPIGWCAQNNKTLQPPDHIKDKHDDWAEFLVEDLVGARTAPAGLLEGPFKGKTVIEMIERGMIVEVQDLQHPQYVWIAEVIRNVGGRLLLRYKGVSESEQDFWLFFLDPRLHPFGWSSSHKLNMKPPDVICNKYSTKEEWACVLAASIAKIDNEWHRIPECVFKDQVKFRRHSVQENWKLVVLDPVNPSKMRPATVIDVIDEVFFLATLDGIHDSATKRTFVYHSGSPNVFSVEWCLKHGIQVDLNGEGSSVDWTNYLQFTSARAAPTSCFPHCDETHGFKVGMKLEACNPLNLRDISAATVAAVYGGVLLLELNSRTQNRPIKCYVPASSLDIFPVGWCQSNNFPLSAPVESVKEETKSPKAHQPVKVKKTCVSEINERRAAQDIINPSADSKLWCPVVCFNCVCKSGPFLNDFDLCRVPKYVGPGNAVLVLKEVLTCLIRAAERPHKLLKDLEDFTACQWTYPCVIKTKFGGRKYQAVLHIVTVSKEVKGFLVSLMEFLKCCPYLMTIGEPIKQCPLGCLNVRRVGRPPKLGNKRILEKRANQITNVGPHTHSLGNAQSAALNDMGKRGRGFVYPISEVANEKPKMSKPPQTSLSWICPTSQKILENLDKRKRDARIKKLHLHSNPLHWSVEEVVEFFESTDCAKWASCFSAQRVDGQALLLLTLPVIQQFLGMKLGVALRVARQVERVKIAFHERFSR